MNNPLNLYEHNLVSYEKIKNAFNSGEKVVGIVHATGTGKSYNALSLCYDNKDKKIIYLVPSNSIIDHLKNIIKNNPNLDLEMDFPNLEFKTYASLVYSNDEDIENLNVDMLILDEFHHIGAPVWGKKINTVIETHPDLKIFGMTAYTVRDRGTSYERDMTNFDTDELFAGKIVSHYDLCDAIIDGVLPKPVYKSAYTNLDQIEKKIEEKALNQKQKSDEYQKILEVVKRKIHEAPSIIDIIKTNIKPNGKYIYFCPPVTENGINDLETIKKEAYDWFKSYIPVDDIIFYSTTSEMGLIGQKNREAFYDDKTLDGKSAEDKLRVMFAINQYNEGVHAPNVDGVIMGRSTSSDIVYFEQLGRALAVNEKTKEQYDRYDALTINELKELLLNKGIKYNENLSKEELIEKLLAPIIIDLTNNYNFIKELENNLKNRVREIQLSNDSKLKRKIRFSDASFDIEIINQSLYDMLVLTLDRLVMDWYDYYNYAVAYFNKHGNLDISSKFKTNDGINYDENGYINLGSWLYNQKVNYKNGNLSKEKTALLEKLKVDFYSNYTKEKWIKYYKLAENYYQYYGNLEVPNEFKTNDGIDLNEDGLELGTWIYNQRRNYNNNSLSQDRYELLKMIGMRFDVKDLNEEWLKMYNLAKQYYEYYGNLKVPSRFKTNDGINYDENGYYGLGNWVNHQRIIYQNGRLSSKRIELLNKIGMRFQAKNLEEEWLKMYNLAKNYYNHYGNLRVPSRFKTDNGINYNENSDNLLGRWIHSQKVFYQNNKLSDERIDLLKQIGMSFELKNLNEEWQNMYNLAKSYYEYYGNLNVPVRFKTTDGINYDDNGIKLGMWLNTRRGEYKKGSLSEERINLLNTIGMVWSFRNKKNNIKHSICINHNIDEDINADILEHLTINELYSKIEYLLSLDIPIVDDNNILHEIFSMSNADMKEKYHISLEELITKYKLEKKVVRQK